MRMLPIPDIDHARDALNHVKTWPDDDVKQQALPAIYEKFPSLRAKPERDGEERQS
jgi:hypothetical protein